MSTVCLATLCALFCTHRLSINCLLTTWNLGRKTLLKTKIRFFFYFKHAKVIDFIPFPKLIKRCYWSAKYMVIKARKSLKGSSKLTKEMWQDNKREQLLKNFLLLYNIYESIDEFPRRDQLLSLQDAASLSWGVSCLRRSSHVFTTVPPCNLSTFGKQLSTAETWRKRPAT